MVKNIKTPKDKKVGNPWHCTLTSLKFHCCTCVYLAIGNSSAEYVAMQIKCFLNFTRELTLKASIIMNIQSIFIWKLLSMAAEKFFCEVSFQKVLNNEVPLYDIPL